LGTTVAPTAEQKILEFAAFDCILFSHAAKNFGICQQKQLKSTAFCSATHRKSLE
jgi:hypothetical protein